MKKVNEYLTRTGSTILWTIERLATRIQTLLFAIVLMLIGYFYYGSLLSAFIYTSVMLVSFIVIISIAVGIWDL